MTERPRPRRFAGVIVDAIDWTTRRRRYVCARCSAVRLLPCGAYRCLCGRPPSRLEPGLIPPAVAAELERLIQKTRNNR